MQAFVQNFLNPASFAEAWPLLLQGLEVTLVISVVTIPLAMALGLAVAVLHSFHIWPLNPLLIVYLDFFRSFPVLVLLALIFYGLPFLGITLREYPAVVLAIALNNSGYYGEIFRAGIESIARGQREAARSTGLSALQTAHYVILPQAVRNVAAPLASNTLELIKMTSIGAVVALPELLRSARVAQELTYDPTPLTAAAVIYFVLLWPFARLVARLERQMLASR